MKSFVAQTIIVIVCGFLFSLTPSIVSATDVVVEPEPVQRKYESGNIIRVLIVPGHDDEFSGAQYGSVVEADLALSLGKKIVEKLSINPQFFVTITRNDEGYIPELSDYFLNNEKEIRAFIKDKKKKTARAIDTGKIIIEDQITHNDAPSDVAYRLYAINKWASENKYDLILHIHFNDYWPRSLATQGEYGGFTVYAPDQALLNGVVSESFADAIGSRLKKTWYPSNLPIEKQFSNEYGVVPDFKLIALGSNMTLSVPSILVEYSYIYEPFLGREFFDETSTVMAQATTLGIFEYLQGYVYESKNLSYEWTSLLSSSPKRKPDIIVLQYALRELGMYPPAIPGKERCPISGIFGPCTKTAVQTFQKSQQLLASGVLTPTTRTALNELFK